MTQFYITFCQVIFCIQHLSNPFLLDFLWQTYIILKLCQYTIDFLGGSAFEEIQISAAETRISILPYQTLFMTGRCRHPTLQNVPQTYPRINIPVLQKLLSKPNSEKGKVGGHKQFSSPEELLD